MNNEVMQALATLLRTTTDSEMSNQHADKITDTVADLMESLIE